MRTLACLTATALLCTPAWAGRLEAEIGASMENLDKGYADWESRYLEAGYQIDKRQSVYGMVRQTERFAQRDSELLAGYYHPLGPDWTLVLEGNFSPTHEVLAKWSAFAQVQRTLPDGWGAHLGLRRTEYTHDTTSTANLTLERYWSNYRAGYTFYSSYLEGSGSSSAHRLQFDYYYGEHSRVGLYAATGRELENQGTTVLASDVYSLGLVGRHWLNPDWAIIYELSSQRQGDLYTRNGIKLGLRRAF
ncbi:YaiO family outer membrane protein [Sulfuritortus calidifontis]|uniref:YaiO family outer membrane protein n=1 Tax=Sulfuritortus calidifontis TaxID=1914471 RepID=A0A4R3JUK8_9PROT|nr:YaiO family outer membrane beta-barrel protein [Sulfuritortus calidifontis]TCS71498.1 YaiO family outer membrane protein [Sulfuritortus calidifontis]